MVTLRPLEAEHDLPYLMALEQEHNANGWIGHDSEETHRVRLAGPANRYYIIEHQGAPAGFVIIEGIEPVHRNVLVKRIAVSDPGCGIGREALRQVIRLAFSEWNVHRLWLDVYEDNPRARRTYRALGFVEEGTLRESAWHGNRFRSLVVMSLLEGEAH